jgi:hypothetical protein
MVEIVLRAGIVISTGVVILSFLVFTLSTASWIMYLTSFERKLDIARGVGDPFLWIISRSFLVGVIALGILGSLLS